MSLPTCAKIPVIGAMKPTCSSSAPALLVIIRAAANTSVRKNEVVRFANLPVIASSKLAKHFFHPSQNFPSFAELHAPITATAAPERLTSCRHRAEAKTKGSGGPAATTCDLRKCYAHHTRKPDAVDTGRQHVDRWTLDQKVERSAGEPSYGT